MSNKVIIIKLMCFVFILHSYSGYGQSKSIEGVVSDNSGNPLPGVTLIIKGTNYGASTDFDGKYNLNATIGDIVVFSYVGFKTNETEIGSSNSYNIIMQNENLALDEIVVVGSLALISTRPY